MSKRQESNIQREQAGETAVREALQNQEEGLQSSQDNSLLSSRRPLTRSQTGRASKRKLDEDEDHSSPPEPRNRITRARKKNSDPDSTFLIAADSTSAAPLVSDRNQTESPPPVVSRDARNDVPPLTATQLTFLDSSTPASTHSTSSFSSSITMVDTANLSASAKSRANLPVPVPNLTKKSRGRRVPTKPPASTTSGGDAMDSRMYVCTVENCGKCFHRGEHLKRHIRSIHTHEKPFKCSHPLCDKHFNRHDNLLQHLKVHKQIRKPSVTPSEDEDASRTTAPVSAPLPPAKARQARLIRSASPLQIPPPPPSMPLPSPVESHSSIGSNSAPTRLAKGHYPYYSTSSHISSGSHSLDRTPSHTPPAREAYETSLKQGRLSSVYRHPSPSSTSSGSFRTFSTYGSLISERSSFASTSMAVSSLRTEIPQSPPSSSVLRRKLLEVVSDERSRRD